jgi:tetratricopeptide (TPR) repeat protein
LFFYLAVFSKEHAVTALPVALLVAWNAADGDWRKTFRQLTIPLPLWIITAAIIVLRMKGIIGSAYEPIIGEMLQGSEDQRTLDFLLRSVVNQSWLFFKYGLLWLLPIESWMSIDLREPFPTAWYSWPWAGGALAYLAYPLITAFAIWRGWMSRLAGLGLLAPWLLFLTMFSAVQYQESFVLYRSYLWAIPATLLPALLMAHLSARRQVLAITVIGFFLFGLTWSRLQTFSHPVLLWDEAVTRLEGRNEAPGAYRIYHNRGIEYLRFGDVERALADFNKTVAINPAYEFVYNDRGAAYMQRHRYDLALADFNRIILAKPDFPRPYVGRGSTLLILGRRDEGLNDLEHACSMGYGCGRYRQALADDEETKTGSKRQE